MAYVNANVVSPVIGSFVVFEELCVKLFIALNFVIVNRYLSLNKIEVAVDCANNVNVYIHWLFNFVLPKSLFRNSRNVHM